MCPLADVRALSPSALQQVARSVYLCGHHLY
jgi:hypothetical protein